jgi:Mn2+/Fe2+ NRAMP family transporter
MVTALTLACVAGLAWTDFPIRTRELATGLEFGLPASGVALAFSTFGITGVGALELLIYPYWCLEKGYARRAGPRSSDDDWARRARGWLAVMRLDAWFSMVVYTTATVAFYLLGAAVLHPQGLDPHGSEMIATLAQMYVKPLGIWTREIFLLGAWAVLFKTLYVATAGNSRMMVDFLGLIGLWVPRGPARRARMTKVLCVIYPLLALLIYFAVREPKGLVAVGGYAQALLLPLIAGATLYLRQRDTDARVAPLLLTDFLSWIAFFAISAVATYSVYNLIRGF